MVFGGIQKLTLLDYPEKTACTLFTIGCNFCCPYCQNSSLLDNSKEEHTLFGNQKISVSEVFDFLKTREGLLDGVCISGGEPLLYDDLETFISEVKALGFNVKLDTNGSYPQKLEKLISSKLVNYVAMDIKNSPEKYAKTIDVTGYDITPITESIKLLCSSSIPHEFRTTVVKEFHTENDLVAIARWIFEKENYFIQKFNDSSGVRYSGLHSYSDEEMRRLLDAVKRVQPSAELRGI